MPAEQCVVGKGLGEGLICQRFPTLYSKLHANSILWEEVLCRIAMWHNSRETIMMFSCAWYPLELYSAMALGMWNIECALLPVKIIK